MRDSWLWECHSLIKLRRQNRPGSISNTPTFPCCCYELSVILNLVGIKYLVFHPTILSSSSILCPHRPLTVACSYASFAKTFVVFVLILPSAQSEMDCRVKNYTLRTQPQLASQLRLMLDLVNGPTGKQLIAKHEALTAQLASMQDHCQSSSTAE
jgi:hypothetical protein